VDPNPVAAVLGLRLSDWPAVHAVPELIWGRPQTLKRPLHLFSFVSTFEQSRVGRWETLPEQILVGFWKRPPRDGRRERPMQAQAAIALTAPAPTAHTLFHQILAPAAIAFGLVLSAAWVSLLGYGFVTIIESAF